MSVKRGKLHEPPSVKTEVYDVKTYGPLMGNPDDDGVSMAYARYACNVVLDDGWITEASGVKQAKIGSYLLPSPITFGAGVKDAAVFRRYDYATGQDDYRFVCLDSEGYVSQARIGVDTALTRLSVTRSEHIKFLNYHYDDKDVLLLFDSEVGQIVLYDGTTLTSGIVPKLTDACVYNDKVYAVENVGYNRLRFSAKYDPFDWTNEENGAGTVYFSDEGGALRRVIPCGENLYVFRDYAVYKLTAYRDVNDYVLTKIHASNGKIYANTAAVSDGKLYYMTDNGFYAVSGGSVSKEWRSAFRLINGKENATGVCSGGKYYVAAELVTDGGSVGDEAHCEYNNGVVGMMIGTGGQVELIRGVDVKKFLPVSVDGKTYMLLVNGNGYRSMNLSMLTDDGKMYGQNAEKRWTSPAVRLGKPGEDVTVRKVFVRGGWDMTVTVSVDGKERTFEVPATGKTSALTVNERGERVQLKYKATTERFHPYGFAIEYERTTRREYGAN